jgi:hypothetical protein
LYSVVEHNARSSQEDEEKTYRILKDNGVTSAHIIEGFRSPLGIIDDSLLLPKRLGQEGSANRFYIRAMTLPLVELAEEAKEGDAENCQLALMYASKMEGMEAAIERIQSVWPGSVNTQSEGNLDGGKGVTAIMCSAFSGFADNVHTLATMGTDLSLKENGGHNVFDYAEVSTIVPPDKKAAIFKELSEHGVTSRNIPPRFQSPLYFSSIYYTSNVRTQRWMNRKDLMLCVNSVYKWSLLNQIEDERYRTLPDDLYGIGRSLLVRCRWW